MVPDCVLCEVKTRFLDHATECVKIETHSISHSKATGGFHGGKEAGGVKLNTCLYLVQRLRSGAVPPLLHMDEFTFSFTFTGKAKTKTRVRQVAWGVQESGMDN